MSTVGTVRSADLQVSKRNFYAVNLVENFKLSTTSEGREVA